MPGKSFFHPFIPALGLSWGPCWLPAELKLKFNERRNGGGSRLGHSHRSWEGVGDRGHQWTHFHPPPAAGIIDVALVPLYLVLRWPWVPLPTCGVGVAEGPGERGLSAEV